MLLIVSDDVRNDFRAGQLIYGYVNIPYLLITFIIARNLKKWGVFCVYPLPVILSFVQYLYMSSEVDQGLCFDNLNYLNFILAILPIVCINYNKFLYNTIT
jgi:hypothetical protein